MTQPPPPTPTRSAAQLFERYFLPLYAPELRGELARARTTDANPAGNPRLVDLVGRLRDQSRLYGLEQLAADGQLADAAALRPLLARARETLAGEDTYRAERFRAALDALAGAVRAPAGTEG